MPTVYTPLHGIKKQEIHKGTLDFLYLDRKNNYFKSEKENQGCDLDFAGKTMVRTHFFRQKIVFPTVWPETSGSHTNFLARICLKGSNPLTSQQFGEIGRFFFRPSAGFGPNKRIGCTPFSRIFQKSHNWIKRIWRCYF